DELVAALQKIHAGETVVSRVEGSETPDAYRPGEWPGREQGLSEREAEIIALIAQGLSNQEIADQAYLSINTVKSYIRSSYRKMGVTTRSRAVLWGIDHGFRPDHARFERPNDDA
ncbi:MAG: response regulator transcription factor, partial [Marmoricola sp.]